MKAQRTKYKKCKIIFNNELVDFYISHIEECGPSDFGEINMFYVGLLNPVKPMELKGKFKTKIIVPIESVIDLQ